MFRTAGGTVSPFLTGASDASVRHGRRHPNDLGDRRTATLRIPRGHRRGREGTRVNLKTAARRLGVHYQTAYRWVRSGELVAVKVGAGYEISEAALERFQAQRAAMERVPAVRTRHGVGSRRSSRPATRSCAARGDGGAARRSTRARSYQRAAHALAADARRRGDRQPARRGRLVAACRVRPPRPGARGRSSGRCSDSARSTSRCTRASAVGHGRSRARAAGAAARGADAGPARVPPVPRARRVLQRGRARRSSAPASVRGAVLVSRDSPGRPYTIDDRDFVVAVAVAHRCRDGAGRARPRRRGRCGARSSAELADWIDARRLRSGAASG